MFINFIINVVICIYSVPRKFLLLVVLEEGAHSQRRVISLRHLRGGAHSGESRRNGPLQSPTGAFPDVRAQLDARLQTVQPSPETGHFHESWKNVQDRPDLPCAHTVLIGVFKQLDYFCFCCMCFLQCLIFNVKILFIFLTVFSLFLSLF